VVQARQLGDELYVGVHSDEAILENKGPTVMNLKERYFLTLLTFPAGIITDSASSASSPQMRVAG
jgi:hypothetical protein